MTFLFTDVEGSTRLWEQYPDAMRQALRQHDQLLEDVIGRHSGYVFTTAGDAYSVAFSSPLAALRTALDAQLALAAAEWPETAAIRIRTAVHTGAADERKGDYFGQPLNRAARLMGIAHGGQILLSQVTAGLVRDALPADCTLLDLGEHRLKDLEIPERVYQLAHPALPAEYPPLRSLSTYRTNLPAYTTSFVGRRDERREVADLIERVSLLTLLGPGGAGKTRLATHTAADLIDAFVDGVWFVDLAPVSNPQLVSHVIGLVLGIGDQSGGDMLDALESFLREKDTLIILDNCEHVIEEAARIAAQLIGHCPGVTLLATSRELLGVPGETRYLVEPLGTVDASTAAEALAGDAVRLFVERAVEADPSFRLEEADVAAVVDICRRLDGIPLAIELAVARLGVLTPTQLAARLSDRFAVLSRGSRTALARQQTLRAAVDWSYDLLTEEEKILFNRLSVFTGSFALESVEDICGAAPLHPEDVLDLLSSLVDRSLVRALPNGAASRRYRLLETLKAYGAARLADAEPEGTTAARHVTRRVEFAVEIGPVLRTDVSRYLDLIEPDIDDLRAVLQSCLTAGDITRAAKTAASLWYYFYVRGHWDEGRAWLDTVLEAGADLEPRLRADVLRGAAALATAQSDAEPAQRLTAAEVAMRRELDDQEGLATALINHGNAVALSHDYHRAMQLYEESLSISAALGKDQSTAMSNVAWNAMDLGDYELAEAKFAETKELAEAAHNPRNEAWGRLGMGLVAWIRHDLEHAESALEGALKLFESLREPAMVALCLLTQAKVARDRGDVDRAVQLLRESAPELVDVNDNEGQARWLVTAFGVEALRGNDERAALFAGSLAESTAHLSPWERIDIDHFEPEVRRRLDDDRWDESFEKGRTTSTIDALRLGVTE